MRRLLNARRAPQGGVCWYKTYSGAVCRNMSQIKHGFQKINSQLRAPAPNRRMMSAWLQRADGGRVCKAARRTARMSGVVARDRDVLCVSYSLILAWTPSVSDIACARGRCPARGLYERGTKESPSAIGTDSGWKNARVNIFRRKMSADRRDNEQRTS